MRPPTGVSYVACLYGSLYACVCAHADYDADCYLLSDMVIVLSVGGLDPVVWYPDMVNALFSLV